MIRGHLYKKGDIAKVSDLELVKLLNNVVEEEEVIDDGVQNKSKESDFELRGIIKRKSKKNVRKSRKTITKKRRLVKKSKPLCEIMNHG